MKLNGRILNLKRSNDWRGKTAGIRTHENEICSSFAEFDRETYISLLVIVPQKQIDAQVSVSNDLDNS